jgi:hypothetical protein
VYYRLGSSTAIANPEDIARMGRDSLESSVAPVLSLQFFHYQTRQELGNSIRFSSTVYAKPADPLPLLKPDCRKADTGIYGFNLSIPEPVPLAANSNYWREKEKYIRLTNLLHPVAFLVKNQSGTLARNIRVEIIGSSSDQVAIGSKLPDEPEYQHLNAVARSVSFARFVQQREARVEVDH